MSTLKAEQLKRHKSESRLDLPVLYKNAAKNIQSLYQSTEKNEDLKQKVEKDVCRKIVSNLSNEIEYYNIPKTTDVWAKNSKEDKNKFKSIYVLSDLQLLRGTPYYSNIKREFDMLEGKKQYSLTDKVENEISLKKEYSTVEKQMRKVLKQKDGKLLLLNEIYNKLDENIEVNAVVSSVRQAYLKRQEEEKKAQLLDHLDVFHKKIKQEKERQRKIAQLKKLEEERIKQDRDMQVLRGQNRRKSLMNIVKNNTQGIIRKNSMEKKQEEKSPKKGKAFQKMTKRLTEALFKVGRNELNVNQSELEKSQFIKIFNNAFKVYKIQMDINNINGETNKIINQEIKSSNNVIINNQTQHSDYGTRKQLEKYIKGGVDVDGTGEENMMEENLKFDTTPEGIKLNLDAKYSNKQIDSFNSVLQRANFFEKQSQYLEQHLYGVLSNTEAFISSKENTLRIIRLENHTISNKMREIRNYIESLNQQKKEIEENENIQNPDSPTQSHSISIATNNSHFFDRSPLRKGTSNKHKEQRHQLIQDLMKREEKLRDIDEQLQMFKDNFRKFKEKTEFNNQIIKEIEECINSKRKEYKTQTKTQKALYTELLLRGKDIRDEGLSWIIRKLWSLDEVVQKIDLPSFLDEKAKEYLIIRAQRSRDLMECQTLLNIYLDMYKTNLTIQQEQYRYQALSDEEEEQQINNTLSLDKHNQSLSLNNGSQIDNINYSIQNCSLPSINKSSLNMSAQNNLSFVDIPSARNKELRDNKKKKVQSIDVLMNGMSEEVSDLANQTINELSQTKLTSSNLVYDETNVKNWVEQERNKSRNIIYQDLNSSIEDIPSNPLVHKIDLYEDGNHLNSYNNREEFIEEYRKLKNQIKYKENKLKHLDEDEVLRIIKEFDYKQYAQKYNIQCSVVLGAIFGAKMADKLIIKYGMAKK